MRIDASRVCREALQQQPADKDVGTALVFAANRIYRKRSAEVGLAVLKLIEEYASRYEKTRLEVVAEFAEGKVSIEQASTRFAPMESAMAAGRAAGCAGPRGLVAMGYRLLGRAAVGDR
jgi:hypothetical protein